MFSHVDEKNNPSMVDVGHKVLTKRFAHARARVCVPEAVWLRFDGEDIKTPKGPVFHTAIVAGVMAVKKTHELIPFCHPLLVEDCQINIGFGEPREIVIDCKVSVTGKTGVEMESLTGASVAALTLYDMCKSVSHDIVIGPIGLVEKTGGKSDYKLA
jgi:cyclic pyranopterin phosphate synthase